MGAVGTFAHTVFEEVMLTLFYMGGGVKSTPLADYRTLILGGCPKWADFS